MAWYMSKEDRELVGYKDGGSVKSNNKSASIVKKIASTQHPAITSAYKNWKADPGILSALEMLGSPFEAVGQVVGDTTLEATDSPALATAGYLAGSGMLGTAPITGAKKLGVEGLRMVDKGITHGAGPLSALQHFAPRIIDPSHVDLAFPDMLNSVLRGTNGKLTPVYNGGPSLETGLPLKGDGIYSQGTYFSGFPTRVAQYAEKHEHGTTYPMYANLKNPISADAFRDRFGYASPKTSAKIKETLVNEGYDGVLSMLNNKIWEGVAFHPEQQLKSALSSVSPKQVTELKDAATATAYKDLYSRAK